MSKKDFKKINEQTEATGKDQTIADLEDKLSKIEDERKEERFFYIFGFIIFFDVWAFHDASTWGMPIAVGVLELLLLILIGSRMGIESFSGLIDRIFDTVNNRNHDKTEK